MDVKSVDHIAVNAVDIAQSIRFYEEVMGFPLVKRVPNGDNVLVYLRINADTMLELFDHEKEIKYHTPPEGASGTAHIALNVGDIRQWNEHLMKHNVEFTLPLCSPRTSGEKCIALQRPKRRHHRIM